jgi:dienelactone hydrolase
MAFLFPFEIGGKIPGLISAARDVVLAKPGLRAARFLAESWAAPVRTAEAGRPVPSLGLRTAAAVATDEAFRTLMVAMAPVPTARELGEISEELDAASEMFTERGWIENPGSYHRTPPSLTAIQASRVSLLGSEYRHIQFDSEYEPQVGEPGRERWMSYESNKRAHAWVLKHKGRPRPWLICIHGYRMGWPMADMTAFRAAWLHGSLGLNIAIPVLPLHGQRKVGRRSGDGFFSAQVMDTIHAEAQAMWDLRRMIDWIRSQGSDDIGVYGVSLGAYTTALLACLEGELSCAIAGMPPICMRELLDKHAPPHILRAAEEAGIEPARATEVMRVISPLAMPVKVPEGRRYIFGGNADRVVPAGHVEALWEHWDRPKIHWFEGSHLSFTWNRPLNRFIHATLHEAGLLWAGRTETVRVSDAA